VDRFGLDELPVVLKIPQPHVSLIFYSFKFPKGTDIFLFRCQAMSPVFRVQGRGRQKLHFLRMGYSMWAM